MRSGGQEFPRMLLLRFLWISSHYFGIQPCCPQGCCWEGASQGHMEEGIMEIFPSKGEFGNFFPGIPLPPSLSRGLVRSQFSRGASKGKRELCTIQAREERINPCPGFLDAPFPPLEANLDPHREWENGSTTPGVGAR